MGRYVLLTGTHYQPGRKKPFKPGDVVESDSPLHKKFPNKFERANYSKRVVEGDTDEDDGEEDAKFEKAAAKARKKGVKAMKLEEESGDDAAAKRRRDKKRKKRND